MVAVATSIVLRGSLRSAFNGSGEILPRACRVATARRMTGRYEHFDARPGGSYGLLLAYADASVPREVLRRLRRRRPKGRPPGRRPITHPVTARVPAQPPSWRFGARPSDVGTLLAVQPGLVARTVGHKASRRTRVRAG